MEEFKTSDNQPAEKPSAPPVPKELMSARPAMTRVVPRQPDDLASASAAVADKPEPTSEELADRQQRVDYLKSIREDNTKPRRHSRKWLVIVIILLLLVAAGLATAYFFLNKPEPPKPVKAKPTQSQSLTTLPSKTSQEPTDLKNYDSTNFSLSLKYPSSWTLSDTADSLTIISPELQLPGSDGQTKPGAVLLTVRHQQPSLPEFKSGNAVAVIDSKTVSYTQPASGQRGSTYLSYLQYNSTTVKGALDAVYITGNSGYKKTQTIPQSDIVKVNPLVAVSFVSCTGATCKPTAVAAQVNGDAWLKTQTYQTVETMLRSLAIN